MSLLFSECQTAAPFLTADLVFVFAVAAAVVLGAVFVLVILIVLILLSVLSSIFVLILLSVLVLVVVIVFRHVQTSCATFLSYRTSMMKKSAVYTTYFVICSFFVLQSHRF